MQTSIPSPRPYGRIALLLTGLILVIALGLLNFRAAVSNTNVEHNSASASAGEGLPEAMQQREKITIVVLGKGRLADALPGSLAAGFRQAGLGEVDLMRGLSETRYSNPVLVVEANDTGIFWTPFFATAQLPIQASYSSNGETDLLGKTTFISNTNGPVINMTAHYQVNDRSWGFISYPGYHQFLADYLARAITETTKKLYEPK